MQTRSTEADVCLPVGPGYCPQLTGRTANGEWVEMGYREADN
ncbi:hypothetical protein ACH9L7_17585 (plasmid) [Haloferax sp. S1W]